MNTLVIHDSFQPYYDPQPVAAMAVDWQALRQKRLRQPSEANGARPGETARAKPERPDA